jgi:phytoene synthase
MEVSQVITRRSASNLALAFVLLPREKRRGMSALYAFCREVDDVADEQDQPPAARRAALEHWRQDVRLAATGGTPEFAVNRELAPVIARYQLPCALFEELLDGVGMDLERQRYATYEELEIYCYRVASVVGLLSIEIFGYHDPRTREFAVYLGKALQLTNILRDVRVDAARGRIYLPQSELERFGVTEQEIETGAYSDRYRQLASNVADRAQHFYRLARTTLPEVDRASMATAELMGSVYWRLLNRLRERGFDVFGAEVAALSKLEKLALITRSWVRQAFGPRAPGYGA